MAEELAAGHMRSIGFADAKRTPEGVDGGIDVVASSAVAQVKSWDTAVGAPEIQRLRGAAHNIDHALFYSRSGYTVAARDAAAGSRVALFGFTALNEILPENSVAEELLKGGGNVGGPVDLSERLFAVWIFAGVWMSALRQVDDVAVVETEEGALGMLAFCEEADLDDEDLLADMRRDAELASAFRVAWDQRGRTFVRESYGQLEVLHDRALGIWRELSTASRMTHNSTRARAIAKFGGDANRICVEYAEFRRAVDETFPEVTVKAERMRGIWAASSLEDDPESAISVFLGSAEGQAI